MHKREVIVKNYPTYIDWLEQQLPSHRYFKYWFEVMNGKLPQVDLTDEDKTVLINFLRNRLAIVSTMTNEEFDNYNKDNTCPLCLFWHDRSGDSRRFFGNLMFDDVLIENDDGSEAEIIKCVFELVDGEWVCLGEYEETVEECCN